MAQNCILEIPKIKDYVGNTINILIATFEFIQNNPEHIDNASFRT